MMARKPSDPVDARTALLDKLKGADSYEDMVDVLLPLIGDALKTRRDMKLWPRGIDGNVGAVQAVKQRLSLVEHLGKHVASASQVPMALSGDSEVSLAVEKRNIAGNWMDAIVFTMRAYIDSIGLQGKKTRKEIQEEEERAARDERGRANRSRAKEIEDAAYRKANAHFEGPGAPDGKETLATKVERAQEEARQKALEEEAALASGEANAQSDKEIPFATPNPEKKKAPRKRPSRAKKKDDESPFKDDAAPVDPSSSPDQPGTPA
jgi:hypothetical protein